MRRSQILIPDTVKTESLASAGFVTWNMKFVLFEKGFGRLALNNFKGTPIMCAYLRGFFHGVGASLAKAKNVQVREDKCQHRGDPRCEYTFTWTD